jgi:4-hydroxy-3-polyprenylbenzoate decarboxylase
VGRFYSDEVGQYYCGANSKMAIDACNKWPPETTRDLGTPIAMSDEVKGRVDALWSEPGL